MIALPITHDHALIVGNGDLPPELKPEVLGHPRLVVAADGGAHQAQRLGLSVDYLIGDLDSISPDLLAQYRDNALPILHLPSQNLNDLEKAVRFLRFQGITDFTLLGFYGARSDQSMATLCICKKYQQRARFRILTEDGEIYFLPPASYQFQCSIGQTLSLFALFQARGITSRGLAYELKRATLKCSSRGVSNRVLATPVTLTWQKGSLIIYILNT